MRTVKCRILILRAGKSHLMNLQNWICLIKHKPEDHGIETLNENDVNDILIKMGKKTKKDQLDCGACGYESCVEHAIAIKKGLG
jgi:hypothetical protein